MADSWMAPAGLIAMTSPGSIRVETALSLAAAIRACDKAGLQMEVRHFGGSLVDKARNDACRSIQGSQFGFVLFIDGDMTFAPDAILKLVQTAYTSHSWAHIAGGYCVLRGGSIPTIDTGTGTWESHYPNSGVMEVIRTGAAFLLVKREALDMVPQPWFSCRSPMRWLDAMVEVDNLARCNLNGVNPFRNLPGSPWEKLMYRASQDPQSARAIAGYEIGEDSGFCDQAKMAGCRIIVDTGVEISHIDTKLLNGASHKERMEQNARELRLAYGILQ